MPVLRMVLRSGCLEGFCFCLCQDRRSSMAF